MTNRFNKQKHITYWLRCLKTFLPHQYMSMDTNRVMLAFFTVSALDLLGALEESTSAEERGAYVDWVYSLQHPGGGFRGGGALLASSSTRQSHHEDEGEIGEGKDAEKEDWDPASVPATYFALATLVILKDDLSRVDYKKCLRWLRAMQRRDGSFGQTLGPDGASIMGGHDTRFGYVAVGIRWILRAAATALAGSKDDGKDEDDVDTDALVRHIRQLQTYDGGFSDEPFHEAHGGYTFCAIAALAIVHRVNDGIEDTESLLSWLVSRQTRSFQPEDEDDEDITQDEEDLSAEFKPGISPVAFNGRFNKIGDTCYTYWNAGALHALGHLDLIDRQSAIAYLVNEMQHFIGGFSKYPGDPPDIFHSYLGLAALGILGHPDVKPVNAVTSFGQEAVDYFQNRMAALE